MLRLVLTAWLFCACACLLSDQINAIAANPGGRPDDLDHVTFEGVVSDANGKHIVAARVIARHISTGNERSTTTGNDGRFRFTTLTPGVYELRVESTGFQTARHEMIETIAGA